LAQDFSLRTRQVEERRHSTLHLASALLNEATDWRNSSWRDRRVQFIGIIQWPPNIRRQVFRPSHRFWRMANQ
jgi:hypothetical protein